MGRTLTKAAPSQKACEFVEFKAVNDDLGIIEGYLSIFGNIDSYGDIVQPGAFTKTISEASMYQKNRGTTYLYPLLWQHNPVDPIGGILDASEDEKGLYIKAQLDVDTDQGKRAFSALKKGYVNGLSIGYEAVKQKWNKGNRELLEIRLMEGSVVTFAANPETNVDSVKASDGSTISIEIDGQHVNLDVHGDASTTPTEEPAMPIETPETPNTLSRKAIDFTAAYSAAQNDLQEQWHDALQALVTSLYSIMSDDETPDKPAAVKTSVNQFADTLDDLATRSAAAKFAPDLDYDGDSFNDTYGNTSMDDDDMTGMIPYMGMMSAGGPDEVKKGAMMSAANHKAMGKALATVKTGAKQLTDLHKKMAPGTQTGNMDDDAPADGGPGKSADAPTQTKADARAGADASAQATTHTDDTDADIQSFRDYLQKEREALRRHA